MPAERERLRALVTEIGRFYVRERALRRAQETMQHLLDEEGPLPEAMVEGYLAAAQRYFRGFEREARAHLKDVDRRLARVSQLQFNLTAERGVAARRVEATQGVLSQLGELARP